MAIKPEAFIDLDEAFAARLIAAWQDAANPLLNRIAEALRAGALEQASALVNQLDLSKLTQAQATELEVLSKSAVLFGASRAAEDIKTSTIMARLPKMAFERSISNLDQAIDVGVTAAVKKVALSLIDEEALRLRQAGTVADMGFARKVSETIRNTGQRSLLTVASLHNSRLANWGFTVEAEFLGITAYQINEQLDGRTCPVCRHMHGKTFQVEAAKQHLERGLSVDNPQDLKLLSPWPRQSREAMVQFEALSDDELVSRGWSVPPFHPMCRGFLVPVGSAPAL